MNTIRNRHRDDSLAVISRHDEKNSFTDSSFADDGRGFHRRASRGAGGTLLCFLLCLAFLAASLRFTAIPVQASSSTLKISGVSRPGTLMEGQPFNVKGTVTSNYRITKIKVSILDHKGKTVSSYTVRPYTYYYNLAAIDDYILFNKAKAGKNYYKISAKDEKKSITKKWSFTVKSSSSDSDDVKKGKFLGYAKYTGVNYKQQTSDSRRIKALNKAKQMCTIKWQCGLTFPAWFNSEGYYSVTTATDGTCSTQFLRGKTYIGIPYSMVNHSYDDTAWADFVKKGFSYNQIASSYYSYTHKTTSKGSDCSYFVYLCMRAAGANVTYQTTYMMYNGQYYKKISKSSLKPGDILLSYEHVRLYAGRVGNRYAVFEETADGSKTRYRLFTKSELNHYSAYRYKKW